MVFNSVLLFGSISVLMVIALAHACLLVLVVLL